MYLRSIASKHVQGEVNAADIEKDVKRRFGIDLTDKLAELQEPMDKSRVCTASMTKAHTHCNYVLCMAMLRTANCTVPLLRFLSRTTAFSTTGDLRQGCGRTGGCKRVRRHARRPVEREPARAERRGR